MEQQLKQLEQELYELFNEKAYSSSFNGKLGKDYIIKSYDEIEIDNRFLNNGKREGKSTVKLSLDRGRCFGLPFLSKEIIKEFFRRKVISEIDAFRFAKVASFKNIAAPLELDSSCQLFTPSVIGELYGSTVVPSPCFYTDIDMNDGKTEGQEQGGFNPNGKPINLLAVDTNAICGVVNIQLKELEPTKDYPYHISFRVAYDLFVDEENSKIYVGV